VIVVLKAVVLMCLVSSVLGVLLVIAERTLANCGTCVIDINQGGKRLEVAGGESLLASLMSGQIFVPSACGGRGTCAYCKVKIHEGGGPIVPTELPLLTDEERGSGVRLSCQVKVRNDIAISIPEELFLVKQFRGVVETLRDLTHDIRLVRIRLVEPETIEFKAGQYVQLETSPYGDNPESVYRAYSLANPPSDNGAVELMIRLVPEGICTTWVFEHLKEGMEVRLNGPYGEFRLSDSDREMVWIAGGSGMAPFWSIVRLMQRENNRRPVTYFFGAVSARDLFLLDELRAVESALPSFKFVPALSKPAESDQWTGERGLITEIVERHLTDGPAKEGYLCGSSGMIDASCKVLEAKGIAREHIFYDKFT